MPFVFSLISLLICFFRKSAGEIKIMLHGTSSVPQIQHGFQGLREIVFGNSDCVIKVKSFCQIGGDGAGQSTAGPMGIGIVNPSSPEPTIASVVEEKIVGIVYLVAALASDGTLILAAEFFCGFYHILRSPD